MTSSIVATHSLGINEEEFYKVNKVTTVNYRVALAKAIGETGTLPVIKQIAFGDKGDVDSYGNPTTPNDSSDLNRQLIAKDITKVSFSGDGSVTFETELSAGDIQSTGVNELALIDENGDTAAKIRLASDMGINREIGAIVRWTVIF